MRRFEGILPVAFTRGGGAPPVLPTRLPDRRRQPSPWVRHRPFDGDNSVANRLIIEQDCPAPGVGLLALVRPIFHHRFRSSPVRSGLSRYVASAGEKEATPTSRPAPLWFRSGAGRDRSTDADHDPDPAFEHPAWSRQQGRRSFRRFRRARAVLIRGSRHFRQPERPSPETGSPRTRSVLFLAWQHGPRARFGGKS